MLTRKVCVPGGSVALYPIRPAVPAILVALTLQAVFFQFGGLTVLGINTINLALPAVLGYYLFSGFITKPGLVSNIAAFASGAFAVFLSGILVALSLVFTEENFFEVSVLIASAHIPVMIIEGIVTAFCVSFLRKVYPEIFQFHRVVALKMDAS